MRVAGALPLPPVGAGTLEQAQKPPAARVPEVVFARLPVSRAALELPATPQDASGARPRLFEHVDLSASHPDLAGPLRLEYTLDHELTERAHEVLKRGRVDLGTVVVLEPRSGRVLAYASTDTERFPPTRTYPAASLVKVITAAKALDFAPKVITLMNKY